MIRHGTLVACLIVSLGLFMGCCAVNGGEGAANSSEEEVYILTHKLPPAQPGIVQDVTIDIFVSADRECYRKGCEEMGDCNTQCVKVEPSHAQIFYHPGYRRGVSPARGGYSPGLAREARWHVQCVGNRSCLDDESNEECVAASECLNEEYTVRIKPAWKTPEQKSAGLKNSGFSSYMIEAAHACARKNSPATLFSPETEGEFSIPMPNNIIFSGPPIKPNFDRDGCGGTKAHKARMLEWYYDVELLRGGKVIMRLDPELWVEDGS
jgi:hypothetical protein